MIFNIFVTIIFKNMATSGTVTMGRLPCLSVVTLCPIMLTNPLNLATEILHLHMRALILICVLSPDQVTSLYLDDKIHGMGTGG